MARTTIDRLIINSPYEEPTRHWRYERETRTFDLVEGRRPAGYVKTLPCLTEAPAVIYERGFDRICGRMYDCKRDMLRTRSG